MADKQRAIHMVEAGDVLIFRVREEDFTPANAWHIGAALKLIDVHALVVGLDYDLDVLPREHLQALMEKSDAQASSGFAERQVVESGSGSEVQQDAPAGGDGEESPDRRGNDPDGAPPGGDPRGFVLRNRRSIV